MTTYKNLRGKRIKTFATDLDNEQAEGQIFYQDTANEFKTVVASAAWAASANMITARGNGGGAGTSTSAFVASGYTTTGVANTEEYNGTGFTTGGNVNTARPQTAGAGTETAGLIAGGFEPPSTGKTEEYNGTSWSEQNDMNVERRTMSGTAGTQTAALYFGGYRDITPTPNGAMNSTESYNGTSWTNEPALNTAVWGGTGDGIQTAAVSVGGPPTQTEHYDGSSWTTNAAINTAKIYSAAAGTTSNIVIYGGTTDGGDTGLTGTTELYDGTSWTEVADLAVARRGLGKAGAYNNAIAMGGLGPAKSNTEEFNITVNTVTAGAWSSGGTIPFSANQKNGSGILTAAFAVGGETPPGTMVNTSVSYNGTSWTATNNINSARGDVMAAGTLTAGLIMGGYQNTPDFLFEETEEFNGTSWSEVNDMPTGAYSGSGTGTQTAAFVNNMYIGSPGERTNVTYEYDGTNWTNGGTTAETTNSRSSVGTLTAGLTVGGRPAPSTYIDETELYDGTSWTAGVDMISEFQSGGQTSKGTQTDCMIFGSPRSPANTDAFKTDGTTWFTQPSLGSYQNNGTGTSTAGLAFGIGTGSQEFAGETTSLNLKTITDS